MWDSCGLMWDSCGLMWTHVGLMWTHVGLMWTHVALMWTDVGLMCRVPHFGTLSTMCTHVCLEITHFVSNFQYPEVLAQISRALSREGRPSSPHTALAGVICSHSSEFFTLELLNVGPWCQQAAQLWGLRRACNSGDGRLWARSSEFLGAARSSSEFLGAPHSE